MKLVSFPRALNFRKKTLRDKKRMRILIFFLLTVLCFQLPFTFAQEASRKAAGPDPLVTAESNYILKDFHFVDGESLPELKLHYRTIGQPARNSSTGEVKNAVLLIHGTTGTGKEFLAKDFREAMFEPGQPLDAAKYYLIIPDAIGLGGSSKPSDGLHDRFPRFRNGN
jgi:homoserine O-acetyltransferase/O-succinyltransferase